MALAGCETPIHPAPGWGVKKIEVPAEYMGLEGRTVAVVVHAERATLEEFPKVASIIANNVAGRLQATVADIRVRDPRNVVAWQHHAPGWVTVPYGDIARELDVDRVVYIELNEFRLHSLGDGRVWEGVSAGTVGVIERDGLDPNAFTRSFNVVARFPRIAGVEVDSVAQSKIETGLLACFIEETSWLFHTHTRRMEEITRGVSNR